MKRWTDAGTAGAPIRIQGVGATRPVIDATGIIVDGSLPNPRAVFQVEASYVTIDNFDLRNAANGDNGSGIRITSFGATSVGDVVTNCSIHNNDMGVMDDSCDGCLIQGCEIAFNGYSGRAGYTHNMYLGGGATTVQACYIHDATQGQNVKSRGHFTALLYDAIENSQDGEIGLVDEAVTGTPNSNAVVLGNLIISKNRGSGWNSTRFIQFGQDLGGAHDGTIYVLHNTSIAGTSNINFIWSDQQYASIVASGNIFLGSTQISPGDLGTIGGTQNWMPTGSSVPTGMAGSVFGSDPGFVNGPGGDYHLTSGASAGGIVSPGETYVDGSGTSQDGDPAQQYVSLGILSARATAVDAGAFDVPGASTSGTGTSATTGTTATTGTSYRLRRGDQKQRHGDQHHRGGGNGWRRLQRRMRPGGRASGSWPACSW